MESRYKLKQYLIPIFGTLLGLLLLKYLLPLVLPFLLGLSVAAALSPLILRLQQRAGLRRGTASALCVSGVLLVLALLLYLLGRFLIREMGVLYKRLPDMLSSFSGYAAAFGRWAERFAETLPGGAGDAFRDWAEGIMGSSGTLASSLYERLFTFVSGFLSSLPDNLLFLLTMILSCYFAAAEFPRIRAIFREHLPKKRWAQTEQLLKSLKSVLGSWLRAQLKLMGVTFVILLVGFLLLRVSFPFFFALGIAVLDALPLFGTGTALLPWGLLSIISGKFHRGVGLLILYGAAALCRNVLEPKLLGAQMGVSPLLTLFAIYVGYRVAGFSGMILLPILVMVGAEVLEARKRPQPEIPPKPGTADVRHYL